MDKNCIIGYSEQHQSTDFPPFMKAHLIDRGSNMISYGEISHAFNIPLFPLISITVYVFKQFIQLHHIHGLYVSRSQILLPWQPIDSVLQDKQSIEMEWQNKLYPLHHWWIATE